MADLPERDDLGYLVYNESMSLACQFGRCDDCPERDQDQIDGCSCVCHVPDQADETADAMAEAWYENYYGTARS